MKIIVTGASGFIGGKLVEFLQTEHKYVIALCRCSSKVSRLLNSKTEIRWGDILNTGELEKAFSGVDQIYHLAAYARNWSRNPETFEKINIGGLRNVLISALQAGVRRVVYCSSEVTFGPSNGSPVTEKQSGDIKIYNDYQRSKIIAESIIGDFIDRGLEVVIVNPTRLFGSGLITEGNSVTKMIRLYTTGKWRMILGDGNAVGNYAYIDDVVNGLYGAMLYGRPGEKYILGGENLSYTEFFGVVKDISGKDYRMIHISREVALGISRFEETRARLLGGHPLITPGWVRMFLDDWACSSEKAKREIGYTITPFKEAVTKTLVWLDRYNRNERL